MCVDSSHCYLGKGKSLFWSKNIHLSLGYRGRGGKYLDVEPTFRIDFLICR